MRRTWTKPPAFHSGAEKAGSSDSFPECSFAEEESAEEEEEEEEEGAEEEGGASSGSAICPHPSSAGGSRGECSSALYLAPFAPPP